MQEHEHDWVITPYCGSKARFSIDSRSECFDLRGCARFLQHFATLRILISSAQQLLTFSDLFPGVGDGETPPLRHV